MLLLVALATARCSSLTYLPAQKLPYTNPDKFKYKPQDVFFMAADDTILHGWYFKSPVRPAKATILLFHGNAQNLTTHFFNLYWAIEQGFDYFIFDYRGYGSSEGKATPAGTIQDGLAALDWIDKHKDPKTKTVIYGQSLGGAIALRVACDTADTSKYDMVILDSTFSSYRSVARSILSRVWFMWPFQWIGWLVMNDTYAPKNCAAQISPRPLLVIHGTKDQTIDFTLGEKIYRDARAPKEFWRVEDGRHTDFLFRDNGRFQNDFASWIVKGPSDSENERTFTPVTVEVLLKQQADERAARAKDQDNDDDSDDDDNSPNN